MWKIISLFLIGLIITFYYGSNKEMNFNFEFFNKRTLQSQSTINQLNETYNNRCSVFLKDDHSKAGNFFSLKEMMTL